MQKNPEFLYCSTPVQVTKYIVNQTEISQIYGIQYVVTLIRLDSTRYLVNSLPVPTITSKLLKIVMKENVWTIAIMSTSLQQRCFANNFK